MAGLTTRNQTGTPTGDENAPQNQPLRPSDDPSREKDPKTDRTGAPGQPLPAEQVTSPPLVEPPNPNDETERHPGDPTISLNADGTVANTPVQPVSMTVPVNSAATPVSDPAFVPSPYQPEETSGALEQKETARLREEAVQAENRFRPDRGLPRNEPRDPSIDPDRPQGPLEDPKHRTAKHDEPDRDVLAEMEAARKRQPKHDEPEHEHEKKHDKK